MWLLPVAVTRLLLFQSMGSGVLAHGLSVWNLPELGNEPVSPASAGGLSATGPPGKSLSLFLPEPSQSLRGLLPSMGKLQSSGARPLKPRLVFLLSFFF